MIDFNARTLLAAAAFFGCSSTLSPLRGDGSASEVPTLDGPSRPDGGPGVDVVQPPVDVRIPRCGDSVLDPGESCDDGNNTSGDGCTALCRYEARCGDGRMDPGEVCDDGNNRSGDGCRSDCRSNERCGNNIVDTEVGEVCDAGPSCSPDCRSVLMCGNNRRDPGEQCDDGNATRWDGCGPDCRVEQAVVLNRLNLAPVNGTLGCDFSGDRRPDNALSQALGSALGIINSLITNGISNGQLLIQLSFLNLTDPLGQNVPDSRIGWLLGSDGNTEMVDNLQPGNPQFVQRASLNAMTLLPAASYQSRIAGGVVDGGPEDIRLTLPFGPMGSLEFRVVRGRIAGTVVADAMHITEVRGGVLCGAVPARDLAAIANPIGMLAGGFGGGGMMAGRSSFLEMIVGGQRVILFNIGPQQPDIDLDGDGLERYDADMGSIGTPPEITACYDGDGTRIAGRECVTDPRMQDGFSSAFQLAGVWIALQGVRDGGGGGRPSADAGVSPVPVDAGGP